MAIQATAAQVIMRYVIADLRFACRVARLEMNGDRRTFERFWPERAMFGHFIHQHDHRIADPNAGMHEPSIRSGQP